MKGLVARWLAGPDAVLSQAVPHDAAAIAALHGQSFHRGWSEQEIERLLIDRAVVAERAMRRDRLDGFIVSRMAAGEAEILSVAVARRRRSRGLGAQLLDLHLRRLAGLGIRAVFLEVDESNAPACRLYHRAGFHQVARREGYYRGPGGGTTAALVLRRDLA
jgi:ribosomal-protein-alanine N-acetyltransferase